MKPPPKMTRKIPGIKGTRSLPDHITKAPPKIDSLVSNPPMPKRVTEMRGIPLSSKSPKMTRRAAPPQVSKLTDTQIAAKIYSQPHTKPPQPTTHKTPPAPTHAKPPQKLPQPAGNTPPPQPAGNKPPPQTPQVTPGAKQPPPAPQHEEHSKTGALGSTLGALGALSGWMQQPQDMSTPSINPTQEQMPMMATEPMYPSPGGGNIVTAQTYWMG